MAESVGSAAGGAMAAFVVVQYQRDALAADEAVGAAVGAGDARAGAGVGGEAAGGGGTGTGGVGAGGVGAYDGAR